MIVEVLIMTGIQAGQAALCSSPGHALKPIWNGYEYIVGTEVLEDNSFKSCWGWLKNLPTEIVDV